MKFRTVCAWCQTLMSEKECSATQNSLALIKGWRHDFARIVPEVQKKSGKPLWTESRRK